MFTKRFPLSELANYWKERELTLLKVWHRDEERLSDEDYRIHLRVRVYCLNCSQSAYKVFDYTQSTRLPYYIRHSHQKGLFFDQQATYQCPHCGKIHQTPQIEDIHHYTGHQYSYDCLAMSFLSDLDKKGLNLLAHMNVKPSKGLMEESLRGYQLFRYQIKLSIDDQTLEILPIECPWDRAYVYLNTGIEVAYEQSSPGEIVKISKNHAFSDIYQTRKSSHIRELLLLEAQNGPTVLNRTGLRNYIESIQAIREDSREKWMNFEDLTSIYRYERFRQDYPCVEQLAKCGYTVLVQKLLKTTRGNYNETLASILLDKHGTNPSRILQYPKAVLKRLKKLEVFDSLDIARAFLRLHQRQPLELNFLESLGEEITPIKVTYSVELFEDLQSFGYRYSELIDYANRAWLGQVLNPTETWTLLRDYVRMAKLMEVQYERFPRYLKVTHDLMQRNFKYQENKLIQKQFEENAKKYEHLCYAPQNESYFITIPQKPDDLVKEGHELSHCVASYIRQVSEGRTMILFLREKENPSKPYITIEWRDNRVAQVKGYGNSLLEQYPKAQTFFTKWTKHVEKLPQVKLA